MAERKRQAPQIVDPLDLAKLRHTKVDAKRALGRAKAEDKNLFGLLRPFFAYLVVLVNAFKPVRVLTLYSQRHGPLMAAGCAYNMFFSVAAMLAAGFSIFGLIASGNREIQEALVKAIASYTPGLIDTGDGGMVKPEQLFGMGQGLTITLVIALVAMVITSLGWIAGLREGIRGIFAAPPMLVPPGIAQLKDLGILLLLGVVLILTTAIAGLATAGVGFFTDFLQLPGWLTTLITTTISPLILLLLDMVVAVVLFRLASDINMPKKALWQTAFIAGVGSTVLRLLSGLLLAGAARNPLLATYAVVIGLFVWFYFLSQVYLIAAAWGAITTSDSNLSDKVNTEGKRMSSLRQRARG